MDSGHFYFTKLLIPALLAGSKSSSDGKARVVNLSSLASYFIQSINLELADNTEIRKKSSLTMLYAQSKLVCIPGYDQPLQCSPLVGEHPLLESTRQEIWWPRNHIIGASSWHSTKWPLQRFKFCRKDVLSKSSVVVLLKIFFVLWLIPATITLSSLVRNYHPLVGRDIARRTPI